MSQATTRGDRSIGGALTEAEAAAHLRAMPLQRLLGNGMEWASATELHRRVAALEPWYAVAEDLGGRLRTRANDALLAGHRRTAAEMFLFASAAYRFGQVPLPDGDRKKAMYRAMLDTYADAASLIGGVEHVRIPLEQGAMAGWLHRPRRPGAGTGQLPVVVIFGGFDGWREEYHAGARCLVQAGLAVLLADLPGQGETRLFEHLAMPPQPETLDAALRRLIDWAAEQKDLGPVGVWGNSMGGYLAARFAAIDSRVKAVCVNGGTDRPAEILDRYPRFVTKVQALFGEDDAQLATTLIGRHHLRRQDLARISAPILILHGEPDLVFLVDSARRIAEQVGSSDRTLRIWPDGDHCLYNHTAEKHALVADWFTDRFPEFLPGREDDISHLV